MASVTNPGLVEAMRLRATTSGVWNNAAVERSMHVPVSGVAMCGTVACDVAHDLNFTGAYNGTAWVSVALPLGDGRPCVVNNKKRE